MTEINFHANMVDKSYTYMCVCVCVCVRREKLCVGGAQLSELCANLDHCAAALSSWS